MGLYVKSNYLPKLNPMYGSTNTTTKEIQTKMSQRSKKKRPKKSIKKREYLTLLTALHQKRLDLSSTGSKRVKFQVMKIDNILRAFVVLFHTGIRMSELQNIKVSDIEEAVTTNEMFIYQSKTNTVRDVFISPTGVEDFRMMFNDCFSEINRNTYILRRWGKPRAKLSIGYTERMLNHFLRTTLGDRYSTHSFRRGLINDMITNGCSTVEVQKMIGHKHISTTSIYADELLGERKKQIINSVR